MNKAISVALAGNPNCGKTTIFNAITGSKQKVGNYPGVTVEKKEGTRRFNGTLINVTDLPGTYSLNAYSEDELVARNFIFESHPDVVVDVLDASNLERNLYLALQLMEMNVPLILVMNMSDVARSRGFEFNIPLLSKLLGVKIIETVGSKEIGIPDLLNTIVEVSQSHSPVKTKVNYGNEVEAEISRLELLFDQDHRLVKKYGKRWLAVKLLEQDKEVLSKDLPEDVKKEGILSVEKLKKAFREDTEIIIAERRYGYISGACEETVKNPAQKRHDLSDSIDKVVTYPGLGLLLFGCLMFFVFKVTFTLGEYPMGWIENGFGMLGAFINNHWPTMLSDDLRSLIVDGVIGGVGGVVVFLPNILLLFLGIAILEDSGYMARAAFIMDKIMHKIGLHGKSFIPMLIGFGCTVPAIMATRILENRRNRLTTIMVAPLMSCGARLPIYALLIPAFFPKQYQSWIFCGIYFLGIVLAIVCAKLLRVTVFKGETMPFVMELPPYRVPTVKGLLIHMWDKGWMYLKKAGTVILMISIVLWAASRYPKPNANELAQFNGDQVQMNGYVLEHSVTGRIGKMMEPVIKPLGFDWKIGTALIGATAAKEVFVSQLGIIFSLGEVEEDSENLPALASVLRQHYDSLTAFCLMVFCLIYAPCIATVAVTRRETGSWKWTAFQFFGLTALAYIVTLIVRLIGMFILNL